MEVISPQNGKPALRSAASAWSRALELTAPIAHNPSRIFPVVIEELSERFGDAPALLSNSEALTFRSLWLQPICTLGVAAWHW